VRQRERLFVRRVPLPCLLPRKVERNHLHPACPSPIGSCVPPSPAAVCPNPTWPCPRLPQSHLALPPLSAVAHRRGATTRMPFMVSPGGPNPT
jgi:hypothetical protein